jgi:hypothetical protein
MALVSALMVHACALQCFDGTFVPAQLRRAHSTMLRNKRVIRRLRALLKLLEKIMNRSLIVAFIGLLAASAASAQNPPAQSGPNNNAVNSSGQNNSDKPVAGRNSFTEGQAKSKIEDAGYTGVTELKKDDNGVWRGKASKGGSATVVSVDFQGNVNTAK